MQLFLLRHAEAESNAASDEARALTVKGTKQAEAIGKFCLEHDFVPELILSSPLTRAEETARLVARELEFTETRSDRGVSPGWYERGASFFRSPGEFNRLSPSARNSRKSAGIMLVGHEPDFSELAGVLIGGRAHSVHFRKATLMGVTLQELKPGAGTIEFLIPAKCA